MKRKLRWLMILVILGVFAVWLEPTRVVWGWLRGEAFYQGRPTSYWERELAARKLDFYYPGYSFPGFHHSKERDPELEALGTPSFTRLPTPWADRLWGWMRSDKGKKEEIPVLLRGDPEAEPVLKALRDHPLPAVQKMVRFGFRKINEGQR